MARSAERKARSGEPGLAGVARLQVRILPADQPVPEEDQEQDDAGEGQQQDEQEHQAPFPFDLLPLEEDVIPLFQLLQTAVRTLADVLLHGIDILPVALQGGVGTAEFGTHDRDLVQELLAGQPVGGGTGRELLLAVAERLLQSAALAEIADPEA